MNRPLQPEHAIDDWRQWGAGIGSRPHLIGKLGGGLSNHSYLLDAATGKLVLRINGADAFLPGADRANEAAIWQAASQRGIAPPLVFTDEGYRYLVSRYIESQLPADPRSDTALREQAFELLEQCHGLDVSAPEIDYASHIDRYWRVIESRTREPDPALLRERAPMRELVASLVASDAPTGLCHHDPVVENFVGGAGRLYLIDWEYAAIGLQVMDYAALATEWRMDKTAILARTGIRPADLETAKLLYGYLCSLWQAAAA